MGGNFAEEGWAEFLQRVDSSLGGRTLSVSLMVAGWLVCTTQHPTWCTSLRGWGRVVEFGGRGFEGGSLAYFALFPAVIGSGSEYASNYEYGNRQTD